MIEHCGQFCRFTVINDCVTISSLAKRCTQDNGSSTRCETAQRTFLNNYRINYFEYLFSNAADLTKLSRNRRCRSLTSSQSTSRRQRGKIRRTLKRKFDSFHLIKKYISKMMTRSCIQFSQTKVSPNLKDIEKSFYFLSRFIFLKWF